MNRTVAQTARVLGVDVQQVKTWAWLFKDQLSSGANPAKGKPRLFTDSDVLALMHVVMHWEERPDLEAIRAGLNCEDHYEDPRYRELLYSHTPLLQEPPENLDETWRHGIFLNGGGVEQYLELARSYRQSAETLLNSALQSGEAREWGYPVLFACRHAVELYLKIIGENKELTHSLEDCIRSVEKRLGRRIVSPLREWIAELDKIDPKGTAFRYADDQAGTLTYAEYWVDFRQLKHALSLVFEALDAASLGLLQRRGF
jgi:HEPN domain-containing protein